MGYHDDVGVLAFASHGEAFGFAGAFHEQQDGVASANRNGGGFVLHGEVAAPAWVVHGAGTVHILTGESAGRPFALVDWRRKYMHFLFVLPASKNLTVKFSVNSQVNW